MFSERLETFFELLMANPLKSNPDSVRVKTTIKILLPLIKS